MSVSINGSGQTVVQVVQSTFTGTATISNGTTASVLSATITPFSTSNKILAMWTCNGGATNNQPGFSLYRNGSVVTGYIGNASSLKTQVSAGIPYVGTPYVVAVSGCYIDSPATTSAITYAIYGVTPGGGTFYINQSASDSDNNGYLRTASSLILMEISGA
jgi:hypothetical protein